MDRDEALIVIRQRNTSLWGQYRQLNPSWFPDFADVKFGAVDLVFFDLSKADLCGSDLSQAELSWKHDNGTIWKTKFDGPLYDIRTKFPEKFDPVNAGARFVARKERQRYVRGRSSVFISYARADGKVVRAIDQWLWTKGLETRIDERDFFAGSELRDEIMRVMSECDVVLVILSAASSVRPWPRFEREFANHLAQTAKGDCRKLPQVIYVVIDNTPLPTDSGSERMNVVAPGRSFPWVCDEIYRSILKIPRVNAEIILEDWKTFVFE
ncbi:MAG TPA: toll/interleukin-1 receptor domain-containing protein [Gemmata sp.]|jgi:hypothetical protein|nr:toll/interleukin-1 receptor domain-containing protein [Gemmata sp.]